MPELSYKVTVASPCPGDQVVNEVESNYYCGSQGDFTYGTLSIAPGNTRWMVEITDFSSGSPCNPKRTFGQVTPNADDPEGTYYGMGSNGPDQSLGQATVAAWP